MTLDIVRRILAGTLVCGFTFVLACGSVDDTIGDDDAVEDIESTSQALSLGSSLGIPVYSGNTCGLNNGVTPSCVASNASDMSFEWTAPSSGTFTFTTNGSNFDSVIVIADYYNPSSVLACAGSVYGTGGESASLSLSSGQRLLVTVDGYASLCGSFKLNITKNCTSSCNTPPPCKTGGTCSIDGKCVYENLCDLSEVCSGGECVPRCLFDPRYPC